MRKAAPLSRKKAKKVERKVGYARRRAVEEAGEVEMRDVAGLDGKVGKSDKAVREGRGNADMEVDAVD